MWCIYFRALRLLLLVVPLPDAIFINLNISAHNHLLCYWVEQPIRLSFFIVPNKHVLLASIFKFGPLLSWNMTIINATEHFEVRHTQLSLTPDFFRCLLVQLSMWTSILHIDGTLHYFYLELFRHIHAFQHCSNHVKYGSIFPLSYSVLLGWVWCCQKSPYSLLVTILHELGWDELASSVRPNIFDRHVSLLFKHCFEPFKHFEQLRFLLQKLHPCFSWKIIYERNEIPFPTKRFRGNRSTNVCVN